MIELILGPDPEVIFELIEFRTWRDNLWLQIHGTNVFKQVGEPGVIIEVNSSVVGCVRDTTLALAKWDGLNWRRPRFDSRPSFTASLPR